MSDGELTHAICALISQVRCDLRVADCAHKLTEEWYEIIREEKRDPKKLERERTAAKELFKSIGVETKEENKKKIADLAPEHLKRVLQTKRTRNVVAMEKLRVMCGSTDSTLAQDVLLGMRTIGDAPVTGNWEVDEKEVSQEAKDVKEYYAAAIRIRENAPAGFPMEALEGVIKEIESDVLLGRYAEISVKELRVSPAQSFPKIEPTKIRVIIDERVKNLFTRLPEKVRLAGVRTIAEIIAAYCSPIGCEQTQMGRLPCTQGKGELTKQIAEALKKAGEGQDENMTKAQKREWRKRRWKQAKGTAKQAASVMKEEWRSAAKARRDNEGPGVCPEAASRDWSKAYYMIGVRNPEENPIAAYDPKRGAYRYWLAYVLNMGNRHSVTSWCRVSELVMRIMTRVGRVVVPIYIDDATVFAAPGGLKAATEAYDALSEALGLELSEKTASNQSSEEQNEVLTLGINLVWTGVKEERKITAVVPEDKYEALENLLQEIEAQGEARALNRKTLEKTLGLANYIIVSSSVRCGAELLRGIYEWTVEERFEQMKKNRNARKALMRSIGAIRSLTRERRPMVFRRQTELRPRITIITDASSDGGVNGAARIAAIAINEEGAMWATAMDVVGTETSGEQADGKTVVAERIEVLEAKAVQLAQHTFGWLMEGGVDALVVVDNVTALYGFIKCNSKSSRTQQTVVEVIKKWHGQDCKAYYEYVLSEDNIADWLTRIEKSAKLLDTLKPTWIKPVLPTSEGVHAPPHRSTALAGDNAKRRRVGT